MLYCPKKTNLFKAKSAKMLYCSKKTKKTKVWRPWAPPGPGGLQTLVFYALRSKSPAASDAQRQLRALNRLPKQANAGRGSDGRRPQWRRPGNRTGVPGRGGLRHSCAHTDGPRSLRKPLPANLNPEPPRRPARCEDEVEDKPGPREGARGFRKRKAGAGHSRLQGGRGKRLRRTLLQTDSQTPTLPKSKNPRQARRGAPAKTVRPEEKG